MSLDSAARAAGVTKPGLMYHFSTKQDLLMAMVDFVIDGYECDLKARIPGADPARESVESRIHAYVSWACEGDFSAGDLVMLTDPDSTSHSRTVGANGWSRGSRYPTAFLLRNERG
ncbi:TetR/AcrR family transcriptional regulator [Janibacter hoylei]|nr:TetR/AcrR family transcriptional regulator [Janibacter hoylei]